MKFVTAREANQRFRELLATVEGGEAVIVTKRGRPVAMFSPYRPAALTAERQVAIAHATAVMAKGLPWRGRLQSFTRDEMHDD